MRSPGVIVQRSLFQQVGRSMIMLVMLAMVVATAGANASPNNNQGSNDLITICKWTGQPGNGGEPHHNQRASTTH